MLTIKDSCATIQEDGVDIKVSPMSGFIVIQITTAVLKGTLIVDEQTDRKDLVSLSNGIADLLEKADYYKLGLSIDPEEKSQ